VLITVPKVALVYKGEKAKICESVPDASQPRASWDILWTVVKYKRRRSRICCDVDVTEVDDRPCAGAIAVREGAGGGAGSEEGSRVGPGGAGTCGCTWVAEGGGTG